MVEEQPRVMNVEQARERAKQLSKSGKTHAEIAEILMADGYRGPQGGTKLQASTVCRLIKYGLKARGRGSAASRAAASRRPEPKAAPAKRRLLTNAQVSRATSDILDMDLPLETRVALLNVLVKHG